MNGEDDSPIWGPVDIDAPVAEDSRETPLTHSFVESLIPTATSLTHSINALHQAHDPLLLTRSLEPGGLFHVRRLVLGEDPMEKSGLDVKVLDVPV